MKKKEKLIREMGSIDDKFIAEADPSAIRPANRRSRYKWSVIAACICLLTVSLSLWLFIPFNTDLPDVSRYADSEYYEIIEKLNELTYTPPRGNNNYELYVENFFGSFFKATEQDGALGTDPTSGSPNYVEVTDNQVQGIIEGDLFKRTNDRAFYLDGNILHVYSVAGEDSQNLGNYRIDPIFDVAGFFYYNKGEIYLSPDGNTVTLVLPYGINSKGAQVGMISLDVSDPANIQEIATISVSGEYISSRSVDGKIFLVSGFYVGSNPDFSVEANFLPQITTRDEEFSVPVQDIIVPENLTSARYTVICEVDQKTLELDGCSALLSYSTEIYVSEDSIYATHDYTDSQKDGNLVTSCQKTEITRIAYGDGFEIMGTVTVDGYLNDQYSMDEYDGMLRAVTTTNEMTREVTMSEDGTTIIGWIMVGGKGSNASLYIIDKETMSLVNSVENFAPWGEIVQSVRFDGVNAYVCTSVQLSDPVFFFDLTDIDNITWKDTGTIEGFSSSLVNFGDGYLLGIGRGDAWNTVKIEVYEESEQGVDSVCAFYAEQASYSDYYKSYYINREDKLVGLAIGYNDIGTRYVLLYFDNYDLQVLESIAMDGALEDARAFIEGEYLYLFYRNGFAVERVG